MGEPIGPLDVDRGDKLEKVPSYPERLLYRKRWDQAITATFLRFGGYIERSPVDQRRFRTPERVLTEGKQAPGLTREDYLLSQSLFLENDDKVAKLSLTNEEASYGLRKPHDVVWLLQVAPKDPGVVNDDTMYDCIIGYTDGDFRIENLSLLTAAVTSGNSVLEGSNKLTTRDNIIEVNEMFDRLLDGTSTLAPTSEARFREVDGHFATKTYEL